jgi:hypothetical protein
LLKESAMSIDILFGSIKERQRPEIVAATIMDLIGDRLTPGQKRLLDKAANVGRRSRSYMSTRFFKAEGLNAQVKVAEGLFPDVVKCANVADPTEVRAYLDRLSVALGKTGRKAGNDFLADRRNRGGRRHVAGVPKGHRAYNKRFRLLTRMEDKYARWRRVADLCDLAQVAKSRLAVYLSEDVFKADLDTACFVAYMTARLNVRSLFTWGKQKRANDEIADMLLARLTNSPTTNWYAAAHVHTDPVILSHLSDEQGGRLLGLWFDLMKRCAVLLDEAAKVDGLNLTTLVVRRGNDSSTWNTVAGAYNKARDGWVALLFALGGSTLLDTFAPPKALRLMAADVAYMHRAYGSGGLEPDTLVWGELPKPWNVVLGRVDCTRAIIETVCKKHGVEGKGWVAPRPKTVATFKPTPELVHGVVIASPELGAILRKANYFCGPSQSLKGDAGVLVEKTMVGKVMVASEATGASAQTTP